MIEIKNILEENWLIESDKIYNSLKGELQGPRGILKKLLKSDSKPAKEIRDNALKKFLESDEKNLDDSVNELASKLLLANVSRSKELNFDLLRVIRETDINGYPSLSLVISSIGSDDLEGLGKERLISILAKLTNESLSNSLKSRAGAAIQEIVRSMFKKLNFEKGVDFREKYRSRESIEVNFVLPAIPDNSDNDVEIALACQMSSNDRIKLASEELKIGKEKFLVTGNGLESANMKLSKISNPIIHDLFKKNIILVCHRKAIKDELKKLERDRIIDDQRIHFFKKNAISFSQFSELISKRLGKGDR